MPLVLGPQTLRRFGVLGASAAHAHRHQGWQHPVYSAQPGARVQLVPEGARALRGQYENNCL